MRRGILLALAFAGLALLALGCDRNAANPLLVPTGIRPKPLVGLTGRIEYDRVQAPDLTTPPYPTTVVELWLGDSKVREDTLDAATREFAFADLAAGEYTVVASARFFRRASIRPVKVLSGAVDVGTVPLPLASGQSALDIHLIGDFNGFLLIPFTLDDSTAFEQKYSGLWYGPNLVDVYLPDGTYVPPDTALSLPAGTAHFRFVTDFAVDAPNDYGGDVAQTIDVPASNVPLRIVSGAGTNLTLRLATAGRYRFTVDERRLTFSVERLP